MVHSELDSIPAWRRFPTYCAAWCVASALIRWALVSAIAVSLFYLEENWRGKRAWERYKQDLQSKGVVLDWSLKPLPVIPDDENFYKAPGMAEWFVRPPAGPPVSRLGFFTPSPLPSNHAAKIMVELHPFDHEDPEPTNADVLLDYDPPVVSLHHTRGAEDPGVLDLDTNVIPLIVMDNVPLLDAIRNLAHQARVSYMLDPRLAYGRPGQDGAPQPQPAVSIRWENITATQALRALLNNYNLLLVPDAATRIARIVPGDPNQPPVVLTQAARNRLQAALRDSFGLFLQGSQGLMLFARPFDDARPLRLALNSGYQLAAADLRVLTTDRGYAYSPPLLDGLVIQRAPERWFFATLQASGGCTAGSYLAWSAGLEPEFEKMRAALKRPSALPPLGSYACGALPAENFPALRTVCQTLAQRAQCHLLLGHPAKALKELTLLHDLSRILAGPPHNRPLSLMAAMMEVALTGLHAEIVEDGLQLAAWQEPELLALQTQLEEVNLRPGLSRAIADEPALSCATLEKLTAAQLSPAPASGSPLQTWLPRLKDPSYLFLTLAPRGWVYQNLVNVTKLLRGFDDVYDPSSGFVVPHLVDRRNEDVRRVTERFSPNTALASFVIPNSIYAFRTTAFNQTHVNQLAMACALERYRLARGRYPDSQEALAPEFMRALPRDIVTGKPMQYSRIPDQGYQLYSVGWDEKDDGGLPCDKRSWGNGVASLDWVWRFPVN